MAAKSKFAQWVAAIKSKFTPWCALYEVCKNLLHCYGGWNAFTWSPFLWIGFLFALLLSPCHSHCWIWYEKAIGILPNLLGFSLGGYAVMLAFGDKKFLDIIRGKSKDELFSPYMGVSASLAFFIIIQSLALVAALAYERFHVRLWVLNFLGCWLFVYSLLLGLAATLRIFSLSDLYDEMPHDKE